MQYHALNRYYGMPLLKVVCEIYYVSHAMIKNTNPMHFLIE